MPKTEQSKFFLVTFSGLCVTSSNLKSHQNGIWRDAKKNAVINHIRAFILVDCTGENTVNLVSIETFLL